jgi:predicted nucleic acid-binding Zn ribbon protein
MAKKSNLVKLGDVIGEFLKAEKLDVKISRFTVKNSWKEIAGEVIARNTSSIFFTDKTIFITIDSSALKHELSFRKTELLNNINKFCGYRLIEEVVIR